jgi:hypothetical protein
VLSHIEMLLGDPGPPACPRIRRGALIRLADALSEETDGGARVIALDTPAGARRSLASMANAPRGGRLRAAAFHATDCPESSILVVGRATPGPSGEGVRRGHEQLRIVPRTLGFEVHLCSSAQRSARSSF